MEANPRDSPSQSRQALELLLSIRPESALTDRCDECTSYQSLTTCTTAEAAGRILFRAQDVRSRVMGTPMQYFLGASLPSSAFAGCSTGSENLLGPISECRFDFTLLFEQAVLSAVPSALLLFLAGPRILYLYRQNEKAVSSTSTLFKTLLSIIFFLLQLALLVLWSVLNTPRTNASIAVSVLNVVVAIQIVALSRLEHTRSLRPSTLLVGYLLFSSLLDLAQVRTLYFLHNVLPVAVVFSASVGLRVVLLVVESFSKVQDLKPEFQNLPPETTSGIINRSLLWWLNDIFRLGSKGIITQSDLFDLDAQLATENVGRDMREAWEKRSRPEGRFAVIWASWRALRKPFSLVVLPRLCLIGFTFAQPFLISRVLSLLNELDDDMNRKRGYGLIAATGLIYLGIAISSLLANHNLFRFITMFRGAMVSLIYERTLTMKDGGVDGSAGVSLMSNDVDQIAHGLEELNEVWSRLIELVIGITLLTMQLGWVSVMPLVVVTFSFGGASIVAKLIGNRQKLWADATQKRVTTTSAMLRDMTGLKMMGLTDIVGEIVQSERVAETKRMESWAWINTWQNVVSNIPFVMAPAATFGAYAIQAVMQGSDSLNTVQAFTSLALITLVSYPGTRLLSALPNLASSIGSFDRIQEFLLAESQVDARICTARLRTAANKGQPAVASGSESILEDESESAVCLEGVFLKPAVGADLLLRSVNIDFAKGSTSMITGAVGAGKTTLLRAILGEVQCEQGNVSIASKDMAYCSQSPWLRNGTIREAICGTEDKTFDETWYDTIIEACSLSQDIARFPAGDQTVIGNRGATLSGGQAHRVSLARALYSRAKIFVLDDIFSALDKRTETIVTDRLFGNKGVFQTLGATVLLATHSVHLLSLAQQVIVVSKDGTVMQSSFQDVKQTNLLRNIEDEHPEHEVLEDRKRLEEAEISSEALELSNEANDLSRRSGDMQVYGYYFKSIGFTKLFIFVFFCVVNVFCGCFSGIWLKWWTDIGGRQIGLYFSVYLLLGVGYVFGQGGYSAAITVAIGPDTGRKLHRVLLQTVLRAPLSLFTDSETGSLLNRFSQDMSLIEFPLAIGILITGSNLIACIAEASLVATGSPLIAFTLPFFILAVYFLQRVYLRTSRQLRFLEIESRSPVYAHFLETIDGLSTIRAFGWEEHFLEDNRERLDNSQKPYHLLFCIQRWLTLVLDLMVAALAVLVVALALSLRNLTSPGLLGVSMNNVLSFSVSLSSLITGWTMLETSLGAIARLRDFEIGTKAEAKEREESIPPVDWPSEGKIQIEDMTASYSSQSTALKNISFTIKPKQRVSVCGRTGSGKSSLLSAILRTLDMSSGSIKIDNIDISTLPRSLIRSRLATIPQKAISVPGSMRLNVDPFSRHSDAKIIKSLQKVQLWSVLVERGGLDAEYALVSLSQGQQQLLALARAILQKSRVVLLDEATSSVDAETDRVVKEVMREEFRECTVVTVAHRPETILDADVVIVLEGGKLVECGVPEEAMGKDSKLSVLLKRSDL